MPPLNEATVFDWHFPGEEWTKSFRFVPGETPFSTFFPVVGMMIAYLVIVLGGRWLMKKYRPNMPFKVKPIWIVHNGILSAASLMLLVTMIAILIPKWSEEGFIYSLCGHGMEDDVRLTALYYCNYIVKFIEFIDTIFIVLSAKPLEFLHVYHHAATMFLCWSQIYQYVSVQWFPIVLNLMVHVVMYYYYMVAAMGYRPWWKRYLTRMQIIQFVLDLIVCYGATYAFYSYQYFPRFSFGFDCHGNPKAAWTGNSILSSYLLLFISFYIKTYITRKLHPKEPVKKPRRAKKEE